MSEPTTPSSAHPDAPQPDPSDSEALKADIEATRAQLAETADALAAKLDVKAQAGKRVDEVGEKVHNAYDSAKASAPEPVANAIGKVEQAAAPVLAKATEDKKRTALIAGGVIVALLIVSRIRKRGRDD